VTPLLPDTVRNKAFRTRNIVIPPALHIVVPDGKAGTREVLKHMRQCVWNHENDDELTTLAQTILLGIPNKAFYRETRALFNWVRNNIRYALDPQSTEYIRDPDQTLALGWGDCDDMCILLASLLTHAGHYARFCALAFEQPFEYTHVITQTKPAGEGDWIALDPTEDKPMGWFPPGAVGPPMYCDV
jgi:transglutaminase-like putative cysteine protease